MKFCFVLLGALFLIVSCSNETGEIASQESDDRTAVVAFMDTVVDYDTVFIVDTIVDYDTVFKEDSIYVVDTFSRCRTEFDSAIVPGKSFFWGNSLLGGYHGMFGMSASNASNDYFSHIKVFFESRGIPFEANKESGLYENMMSLEEKEMLFLQNVSPWLDDSTGLVVLQLGDNIDSDQEYIILKESIDSLLNHVCSIARNAKVLWVGEWYATERKQEFFKAESEKFGVTFVDISDLNVPENQSYIGAVVEFPVTTEFSMEYDSYEVDGDSLEVSFYADDSLYQSKILVDSFSDDAESKVISWVGNQYIVSNAAVATHPNDKAFKEIADRILGALGY